MKKILFYLALIVLILAVIPALATVTKEGEYYTEQDYNCMGGGHVTATTYSADTLDGWNDSSHFFHYTAWRRCQNPHCDWNDGGTIVNDSKPHFKASNTPRRIYTSKCQSVENPSTQHLVMVSKFYSCGFPGCGGDVEEHTSYFSGHIFNKVTWEETPQGRKRKHACDCGYYYYTDH